jgi:ATP-binding cassette subfamily B protein
MSLLQEERPGNTDAPSRSADLGRREASQDQEPLLREIADLIPEEGHSFGRREVRVYRDRVTLHDERGQEVLSVPMSEIRTARTESLVGGARLEVTTRQGVIPVAEFTASVAARFSEMARGIEQLARGEELNVKWAEERTRCARCGRLLPEKDGRCAACVRRGKVLLRILSYMAPYRWEASVVALTTLAGTAASLALPKLTQLITDEVLNTGRSVTPAQGMPRLFLYVGGMLLSLAASALFQTIKGWYVAYLSGTIARDLRSHVYRSLEFLQLSFYDKKQIGAIISRVTQDTDRVWGFLVDGVPYLLTGSLTLVGGLIAGLLLSPKLALAILIPVALVALGGIRLW